MKTLEAWDEKFVEVAEDLVDFYYAKMTMSNVTSNKHRLTKHILQEDAIDSHTARSLLIKTYPNPRVVLNSKITMILETGFQLRTLLKFQDLRVSKRFEDMELKLKQMLAMRNKKVSRGVAIPQTYLDEINSQPIMVENDKGDSLFEPINISTEGFVDSNILEEELYYLRKGSIYNSLVPNSGNSIFTSQYEFHVPNKSVKFLTREEIIEEIGKQDSKPASPILIPKHRESIPELSESMAKLKDFLSPNPGQLESAHVLARDFHPVPILKNSPQRVGSSTQHNNNRDFRISKDATGTVGAGPNITTGPQKESEPIRLLDSTRNYKGITTTNNFITGAHQHLSSPTHFERVRKAAHEKKQQTEESEEHKMFESWVQDGSSSTRNSVSVHRPFTIRSTAAQTKKVPPIDIKKVVAPAEERPRVQTQRQHVLRVKKLLYAPKEKEVEVLAKKPAKTHCGPSVEQSGPTKAEAMLKAYTNLVNFKVTESESARRSPDHFRKFAFESRSLSRQLDSTNFICRTHLHISSPSSKENSQPLRPMSVSRPANKTNKKLAEVVDALRAENWRLRVESIGVPNRKNSILRTCINLGYN